MAQHPADDLDFATRAAHAGVGVRLDGYVPTIAPIVASTTFTGESVADVHRALEPEARGFAYARNANPTVAALELAMASLEGAEEALAFGSGMGATHAALLSLELAPGDVIVAAEDLYGVTRALFTQLAGFEIQTVYVNPADLDAVEAAVRPRDARVLFFETISNPLIRVADVQRLAEIGRAHRATVIVDNTFATPYLFRPLEHGADIVVHSATKYLAGHGDVLAGIVAAGASHCARIRSARTVSGSALSPFEAWLTMRGIRTLPLRMSQLCSTALEVATWLAEQEWVAAVHYPGLPGSPYHQRSTRMFGGLHGGMVAVGLRTDGQSAMAFIDALHLVTPGTSLGDTETLVLYPPRSSHRTLDADGLERAGITEGLIRLSIGLESARDLIKDLEGAAAAAGLVPAGAASR